MFLLLLGNQGDRFTSHSLVFKLLETCKAICLTLALILSDSWQNSCEDPPQDHEDMELSQVKEHLLGIDSVTTQFMTHIYHVNRRLIHIISSNKSAVWTSLCPICTSCLVCYRWHCEVTLWKQHCAALQYILTSPTARSVHLIMLSRCRDRLTLDFAHSACNCFHSWVRTQHVLALWPPCPNSEWKRKNPRTPHTPCFKAFAATFRFARCPPHCLDISPLHYREGCL